MSVGKRVRHTVYKYFAFSSGQSRQPPLHVTSVNQEHERTWCVSHTTIIDPFKTEGERERRKEEEVNVKRVQSMVQALHVVWHFTLGAAEIFHLPSSS